MRGLHTAEAINEMIPVELDGYFDAISNSFDERRLKTDDSGSLTALA